MGPSVCETYGNEVSYSNGKLLSVVAVFVAGETILIDLVVNECVLNCNGGVYTLGCEELTRLIGT